MDANGEWALDVARVVVETFGEFYAPQTKILESRANISDRVLKSIFTYVSTSFGRLTIEKCFENKVRNVCSEFVVQLFDEFSKMSAWLGQRHHHLDAISPGSGALLFRKLANISDHVTWS